MLSSKVGCLLSMAEYAKTEENQNLLSKGKFGNYLSWIGVCFKGGHVFLQKSKLMHYQQLPHALFLMYPSPFKFELTLIYAFIQT